MFTTRRYSTAACILALLSATVARALGPEANALRGPTVAHPAEKSTLVSLGFNGEILPLDAPPAIAALDLLEIDGATEQKLSDLLAARAALMDELVLGHVELLSQVETVMQAGTPSDKLSIIRRGLAALGPAREWGRLDDRLGEALPSPLRVRYDALIDEYENARYNEALARGKVEHRFQERMTRYWEDIAWEIERSGKRVFREDDGDKWFERLNKGLGLTPQQDGQIREMAKDFYIANKGRPTKEQEFEFIARIRTVLTVEQRWKFTAMLLKGAFDPEATSE
ncbi:MAG: hypothetical protein H6810_01725 [Phycisphaeraceae bacterium]|nr:MAG: hypothetical protein H6810_01725 [Phycisphaeraceae bacterium]